MRRLAGFTLLEMMVSTALFVSGAVYVYATFSGVTKSSRSATVQMDLGSHNKRGMTRLFSELQASSLTPQDTDGIDSTDPESVLQVLDDDAAPSPKTKARIVTRTAVGNATEEDGKYRLGAGRQQARERTITRSKILRFRKVVGYRFNATTGSILPEWSGWIQYRVDNRSRLVRINADGTRRAVAHRVDAFDVEEKPDGTVLVTIITARRDPSRAGWKRYANSVTIHPKN